MILQPYLPDAPVLIHAMSGRFTAAAEWAAFGLGAAPGSAALGTANLAHYYPFRLPFAYPVKRAFWYNGATVNGNVDFGIIRADNFALIASVGATAQSGTNAIQYVPVDWLLPPGEYYFGIAPSSATATFFRMTGFTANSQKQFGSLQEASAHPLPATITPASVGALNYMVVCGVTRFASFP